MRNHIVAILLLSLALVGCNTAPILPPDTKYVAVLPDDDLLVDCDVEAPPSKSTYMANYGTRLGTSETDTLINEITTLSQRNVMLTRFGSKNLSNVQVCNARWKKLREWKVRAKTEVNTQKKE